MAEMSAVLLFPGQGAQAAGMGRSLAESVPEARRLFSRAAEVLGYDIGRLCFEGPEEELKRSDRAQPAIFLVSAAALEALRQRGGERLPVVAAGGLSSGEWAGLYAAGVIGFDETVAVLQARGRFMQEACEASRGGMSSIIGLDPETVMGICEATGVYAANFNSPLQTVISGDLEKLPAAEQEARKAGARRVVRLKVAGAFHSPLMEPAAEKLERFLDSMEFRTPRFPVVSNVTGVAHPEEGEQIKELMVRQVCSPVKWVDCMKWLAGRGAVAYLECGPGRVLAGLAKGIDKSLKVHNIADQPSLENALKELGILS